jgi:DNA-directed RNA polymerase subunit E'/Rpb7
MKNAIITRRVYLDPKFLDSNIMEHLLKRCSELSVGECTKEYGHILAVNQILKVLGNEDTIFTVQFEAETLKPKVGEKLSGKVCMIYKDGIFVQVSDKQKMLIPAISIKGYTYDDTSRTYSNGKKKITEGDNIEAIVTAAQYSKQNFSCIGSLV